MSTKVYQNESQRQDENTAKLVMSTFYKLTQSKNTSGTTAEHIARYLREKFGDVFRTNALVCKAEETLSRSAALGFLTKSGKRLRSLSRLVRHPRDEMEWPYSTLPRHTRNNNRYAVKLAREGCAFGRRRRRRACCCRKRRRRRSRRRRRKRCRC